MEPSADPGFAQIEVGAPLGRAWEHMKEMLFPFDFTRWISLGLIAFLATLGSGGGGGFNAGRRSSGGGGQFSNAFDSARQYVADNLGAVLAVGSIIFVIALALYLTILYLRSRGIFMYLHAVYERSSEVGAAWGRAREPSWSLFVWSICLDLTGFAVILVLALPAIFVFTSHTEGQELGAGSIGLIFVLAFIFAIALIILGVVRWLLKNLVAPVMYVRACTCSEAWREFLDLIRGHRGTVFLYLLMNIALGFLGAVIAFPVVCITCCIGALPVIHQTIMQPYYLFVRAYGPYFLAQFGGPYQAALAGAGLDGGPAVSADAMRIVICPHCDNTQQVPVGRRGTYACATCNRHFQVE